MKDQVIIIEVEIDTEDKNYVFFYSFKNKNNFFNIKNKKETFYENMIIYRINIIIFNITIKFING